MNASTWIRPVLAVVMVFGSGCVRPPFHAAPVAPGAKVGTPRVSDSLRVYVDSLSMARAAERSGAALPPAATVSPDRLADVAWMDILRDTVLTSLVRVAVQQNRDVALARARISEFRAQLGVARAPYVPRVTANASVSTNQATFGSSPPVQFEAWRATGDVAWELDFWGRIRSGVVAATADVTAQQFAERATVLSLVSDVASGYLQLLELDDEREIATRTLASRRATLTLAQERFARGVVSELDVRQFEGQLAVPTARLAQVERLRSQQEHALNVLLGEAPAAIPRGGTLLAAARSVTVPDSLPATLLERRPDVAQSERLLAAASARVGVAAAARLPAVQIAGSYGTQATTADRLLASGTNVYQLQLGVSVPLFAGGRYRSDIAAARARAEQARAVYERTALTALREAGDALVAARTAGDEVTANETLVGALRRALDLSNLRYQSGVASFLEVLDAQRGLFDAELSLSQSRLRQLTASVQLYRALGGSWPSR
ncbi:MAG: efflux transporter outer membrane subunit [Gemmatimonadaceae bacterium]